MNVLEAFCTLTRISLGSSSLNLDFFSEPSLQILATIQTEFPSIAGFLAIVRDVYNRVLKTLRIFYMRNMS